MFAFLAQSIVVAFALCGLLLFAYVQLFSARALGRHGRRLDREACQSDPRVTVLSPPASPGEQDLLYLHYEQINRITAAKLEIIRSAADTGNRLLLMHAKAACDGGAV